MPGPRSDVHDYWYSVLAPIPKPFRVIRCEAQASVTGRYPKKLGITPVILVYCLSVVREVLRVLHIFHPIARASRIDGEQSIALHSFHFSSIENSMIPDRGLPSRTSPRCLGPVHGHRTFIRRHNLKGDVHVDPFALCGGLGRRRRRPQVHSTK